MSAPASDLRAAFGSRALFPSLQAQAYLAHAAISPLSLPVSLAVQEHLRTMQERGAAAFGEALETRQRLRESLASLIGTGADNIAFVQNTGAGLSAIATALRLQPGQRLGLFAGEYPSNVATFQQVALRAGARVQFMNAQLFLSDQDAALSLLERELQQGLCLVAVSAVQFQTGLRMPLAKMGALCRSHGALLCVDAVQALGAVPVDVESMHIDLLACGAHKWLMGMDGLGFMFVRPEVMPQLQPLCVGATSYEHGLDMLWGDEGQLRYDRQLLATARVFEAGMVASTSVAALNASLNLIQDLGISEIHAYIQRYHDLLEPELVQRGFRSIRSRRPEQRSGILSLHPPSRVHAGKLIGLLQTQGVLCSSPDGLLRVAPHWPNALSEVPHVIAAVDCVLSQLAP